MQHKLLIADVEQEPIDFTVSQTTSSGAGIFTATIPYSLNMSRGDSFQIDVEGETLLSGEIKKIQRQRSKNIKKLTCYGKTQKLINKICIHADHREYTSQDAGAVVNDLVDYYFSGILTTVNVNTTTGVTIDHIDVSDKTVLSALKELARRANCDFYVDESDDLHFFVVGNEVAAQYIEKEDIIDIMVDEDDTGKKDFIRVRGTGVTATSGSGDIEYLHVDPAITTNTEAQNVADYLYNQLSEGKVNVKVEVYGFYNVHRGEKIRINSPFDNVENEFLIIQSIVWTVEGDDVSSILQLGAIGTLGDLTLKSSAGNYMLFPDLADLLNSKFNQTDDNITKIVTITSDVPAEGDYSTYTLKWESATLTDVDRLSLKSSFITDESKAFIIGNGDLVVATVADGTLTETAGKFISIAIQWAHHSIYGKYNVGVAANLQSFDIYKDGNHLQTINVEAAADDMEGIVISHSGKYIIIVYEDDSNPVDEFTLKCYEGS